MNVQAQRRKQIMWCNHKRGQVRVVIGGWNHRNVVVEKPFLKLSAERVKPVPSFLAF